MEIVLGAISLVAVIVSLSSSEVVPTIVSLAMVVSSCRSPIPIDIHRDQGIVHPSGGIGQIVLGCGLSL